MKRESSKGRMSNQSKSAAIASGAPPGMTREEYLAERSAKIALSEKQGEFLDQWLLTLSGGALGLALTFLHDHGPVTVALPVAIAGMGLLVGTLISVLVSVAVSQRSISIHVDTLDDWCKSNFQREHESEKRLWQNPWAGLTLWLNRIAIGACIFGILLLSAFVVGNLPPHPKETPSMQKPGNNQTQRPAAVERVERGAVIKPPPVSQAPQQSEKK